MPNNITAAEEVLLAAYKLSKKTQKEFTEWDLTVETWILNKNRWGLRGYEQQYPDHKRVMNEIMAKGTQKAVGKGWLERTKPNHYRLTSLGLAKGQSLTQEIVKSKDRSLHEYNAVSPYINHSVFQKYCSNSDEPKTWLGAAAFLGLNNYSADSLNRKIQEIKGAIQSALDWLNKHQENVLVRDDSSKPIPKEELIKLQEFLITIEKRFAAQFAAIRRK